MRPLAHRLFPSVLAFAIFWTYGKAAKANPAYYTVDMALSGYFRYEDVMSQAEQLASIEIVRQFNASPNLNELQVVVLGQRYGEIVPILSAQVSREQWLASPRASSWIRYYNAAYSLLNRTDEDRQFDRIQPASPYVASQTSSSQDPRVQVESAFSEGRLSRREYQDLVDALD